MEAGAFGGAPRVPPGSGIKRAARKGRGPGAGAFAKAGSMLLARRRMEEEEAGAPLQLESAGPLRELHGRQQQQVRRGSLAAALSPAERLRERTPWEPRRGSSRRTG